MCAENSLEGPRVLICFQNWLVPQGPQEDINVEKNDSVLVSPTHCRTVSTPISTNQTLVTLVTKMTEKKPSHPDTWGHVLSPGSGLGQLSSEQVPPCLAPAASITCKGRNEGPAPLIPQHMIVN